MYICLICVSFSLKEMKIKNSIKSEQTIDDLKDFFVLFLRQNLL